jgi:hypothetical protein
MNFTYPFPKLAQIPLPDKALKISGVSFAQPAFLFINALCDKNQETNKINLMYLSSSPSFDGTLNNPYVVNIKDFIKEATKWKLYVLSTTPMSSMVHMVRVTQQNSGDNDISIDWNELVNIFGQKYGVLPKKGNLKLVRRNSLYYWDHNNYTIIQSGNYKMDEFTQSILGAKGRYGGTEDKILSDKLISGYITYPGYLIRNQFVEIFISPEYKTLIYRDLQVDKLNKDEKVGLCEYAKNIDAERRAKEAKRKAEEEEKERKRLEAIEAEKRRKEQDRIKKIWNDI